MTSASRSPGTSAAARATRRSSTPSCARRSPDGEGEEEKMPKNIDVAKLLNDPEFMETWAQYPTLVEEETAAIMEQLAKTHQTVPLTVPKASYAIIGTRQLRINDVPRLKGAAKYTHDVAPVG